MMTRINV